MFAQKILGLCGVLAAFGTLAAWGTTPPPKAATGADAGPIRLVRFSYLHGAVSWRASDTGSWHRAALNLPLRQGAQVWVNGQGRAELQFDDGSELRLGPHALVTLQTLSSDTQGEFTELTLPQGLVSLHLQNAASFYQVDTPAASVQAVGPAQVRVQAQDGTEIAVERGQVQAEDDQFRRTLDTGEMVDVTDAQAPLTLQSLPPADAWDKFNARRDRAMTPSATDLHYLPPQLALVSGDLSREGDWRQTDDYGEVWVPSEPIGWVPYRDGHWVWVDPFGWTWVSPEPWGWVTYHYGTWLHTLYGWAWVPGAGDQYWSPAVVAFAEKDGEITWAPLAPWEVNRTIVLGHCYTGGPDWSVYFSVGGAAVYDPEDATVCEPVPWPNRSVNQYRGGPAPSRFYTVVAPQAHRFVPSNAGSSGASEVRTDRFGLPGHATLVPGAQATAIFRQGRSGAGRTVAGDPVSGPVDVRPSSSESWQVQVVDAPPPGILSRAVLRPSLPPHVGSVSSPSGVFVTPAGKSSDRTAQSVPSSGHRRGGDQGAGRSSSGPVTVPAQIPMPPLGSPQSSIAAPSQASSPTPRATSPHNGGGGWAGRGGIARGGGGGTPDFGDTSSDTGGGGGGGGGGSQSSGGGGRSGGGRSSGGGGGITSGHRR